jgi:hypothetical protein
MISRRARPAKDDAAAIGAVADARTWHKAFFAGIRADWIAIAQQYVQNGGNPWLIAADARFTVRRTTLVNLYTTAAVDNERDYIVALREAAMACPYCGGIATGTIDHFLPKDGFPEFTVVPSNLVPSCDPCNRKKTTTTTGAHPERFLHPYFDVAIDTLQALLTVADVGKNPTFGLQMGALPNQDLQRIVDFHLRELDVEKRLVRHAGLRWKGLCRTAHRDPAAFLGGLQNFLTTSAGVSENTYGPRNVETVFYRGILASQEAMDYLHDPIRLAADWAIAAQAPALNPAPVAVV